MKKVRLKVRVQWGDQPAGSVLEFEEEKAKRIIAAGYAEYAEPEPPKIEKQAPPVVETTDAPMAAEQAVVNPQIPKRGPGRPRTNPITDK